MRWSIAALPRNNARNQPDRTALDYAGEQITYAQMDERSNRVAQGLLALGLKPGERIALLDKNSPGQFDILFGAGKAGLVTVPVNWRLAPPEMAYILNDSQAKMLFVGEEFLEGITGITQQLAHVSKVVVMGEGGDAQSFRQWRDRHEATDPHQDLARSEPVLQLYTSGTTGRPKGVLLTDDNLFTLLDHGGQLWGLNRSSVSLVCLPLFHIGGIGWAMACMRHGGSVLLIRNFDPATALASIEKFRVTHANFVPAMMAAMMQVSESVRHDYGSLELVLYGTAPISTSLLADAMDVFGCKFAQVYGLTETTSAITQLDPDDHDPAGAQDELLRSAGRPYPWVEAQIVDPSSGDVYPAGKSGELWVRSPQNMKGYWRTPEASAETITTEGWLRTGDVGYFNSAGYLFLTDRIKDMIVSGGENIYPAEVENALMEHPAVAEAAVIGIPDKQWGESVKAVIVPEPGCAIREPELIGWVRRRVAHYKCPRSLDVTDSLPRTATGKVLKRMLREPYWRDQDRNIN